MPSSLEFDDGAQQPWRQALRAFARLCWELDAPLPTGRISELASQSHGMGRSHPMGWAAGLSDPMADSDWRERCFRSLCSARERAQALAAHGQSASMSQELAVEGVGCFEAPAARLEELWQALGHLRQGLTEDPATWLATRIPEKRAREPGPGMAPGLNNITLPWPLLASEARWRSLRQGLIAQAESELLERSLPGREPIEAPGDPTEPQSDPSARRL